LQICLLQTTPFHDRHEGQIGDWHADPVVSLPCQNRPLLVEKLANALLEYEDRMRDIKEEVPEIIRDMRKALWLLQVSGQLYLKRRGQPTQAVHSGDVSRPTRWQQRLERAHQTYATVLQRLTPTDYIWAADLSEKESRGRLCQHIYDSFKEHGPQRKFHGTAIYHAMALVLKEVGLEDGEAEKISSRFRRRIGRAHP
jgi:hypothetical protein